MNKNDIVYNYLRSYMDSLEDSSDKLPSEAALMQKLSVSRTTVRKAIERLKNENLVYSVRGSGSYFKRMHSILKDGREYQKVGVFLQGMDLSVNKDMIDALLESSFSSHFKFEVFHTANTYKEEENCLKSCLSGYYALIIDPVQSNLPNPNLKYYRNLMKKGFPFIFYHSYYPELSTTRILVDEKRSAELLVARIVELGLGNDIGGVFFLDQGHAMYKYRSLLSSMESHGIKFNESYFMYSISSSFKRTSAFQKELIAFFRRNRKLSAFICCNEQLYGMVIDLRSKGLIRDNFLLCCFDASLRTSNEYGLCTIHPGRQMGNAIASLLHRMEIGEVESGNSLYFDADLNDFFH